ncbi:MAG: hypothetical protein RI556_01240 [Hydrogenovibrio sp.]|uniref:hypothetical protein n=1 Tax=Hydrogenovibrio sp. TaxID=2065821 RepID=UPI002870128C|nr:hypothetical protein [Hydrogenovibrio sp.]MDR9497771.1 hypothetical protein [Hydrogenovibrio sp.]
MNYKINSNNKTYEITGSWHLNGMNYDFKGSVTNGNKEVMQLGYSFPLSFHMRYGIEMMENEILATVKDHLDYKS